MYHAVTPGYIVTGIDWGKGFSAGVGGCNDFHFVWGLGVKKLTPCPLSNLIRPSGTFSLK
jgi:hypothetical protein